MPSPFPCSPVIHEWSRKKTQIENKTEDFVIVTQEKAWIDEYLVFIWFDQVWKSYAKKKAKGIGFQQIVNGI